MLAIIRKVNEAMESFAPAYVRPAEKCLFRIYRDTRFSNNKLPYKTHVAAWWMAGWIQEDLWRRLLLSRQRQRDGGRRRSWMPDKEQLAAIRHWLLDHHLEFRKLLQKPNVRKVFEEFEGNALTRPPKGFPCEHPGMDLIKCRQWGFEHDAASFGGSGSGVCQGADSPLPAGRACGGSLEFSPRCNFGAQEKGTFRA